MADYDLMAFDAPDLALYHAADIDVEKATALALETEQAALNYDKRIVNSEGAAFNSHTGVRVYGNTHGCYKVIYPVAIRYLVLSLLV